MKVTAITLVICLGIAGTAAAEGSHGSKSTSSAAPSKADLAQIRTVVHELERSTGKLIDLMSQYRSMIEQRPQAKKQLEKWNKALDRLVRRIAKTRDSVAETMGRMDEMAKGKLPTALAKDVANAHNQADAERAGADQVLAKHKPKPEHRSKRAKKAPPEDNGPPPLGDIDDL